MKTILALATIAVLVSPALADKHRPPSAKPVPPAVPAELPPLLMAKDIQLKLNFGDSYALRSRTHAPPAGDKEPEQVAPRSLTDKQISRVIDGQMDDVEYCWLKMPAKRRVATTANLHLAIDATGNVTDASVDGVAVNSEVSQCIATVAARWIFPTAETGCKADHAIGLKTR